MTELTDDHQIHDQYRIDYLSSHVHAIKKQSVMVAEGAGLLYLVILSDLLAG